MKLDKLRVVRAPGECLGLTLPKDRPLKVGRFFWKVKSELAKVQFFPPEDLRKIIHVPLEAAQWAGEWIAKCCRHFDVSPRWLLTILQAEQGLVMAKKALSPAWSTRHLAGEKAPLFKGERRMRTGTKKGWLAVGGNWKMMAAAGYAIPDPGAKAHFPVEKFLGFPRQIFYAAKWLRQREDEFTKLERQGLLPKVMIYTREIVFCADRYAYKTLRYTPSEKVMAKRGRVYRMLAKRGGEIWHS